jgi:hypothetical protein
MKELKFYSKGRLRGSYMALPSHDMVVLVRYKYLDSFGRERRKFFPIGTYCSLDNDGQQKFLDVYSKSDIRFIPLLVNIA